MTIVRGLSTLCLAAGLLAASDCAHQPGPAAPAVPGTRPPSGVTSQQNAADLHVVDQLANARCDHEATCGNIGAGKKYADRQVCVDAMRGHIAPELTAYSCPLGIDQGELAACLEQLRKQSCSFSVFHLFSANKCAASALCIK